MRHFFSHLVNSPLMLHQVLSGNGLMQGPDFCQSLLFLLQTRCLLQQILLLKLLVQLALPNQSPNDRVLGFHLLLSLLLVEHDRVNLLLESLLLLFLFLLLVLLKP